MGCGARLAGCCVRRATPRTRLKAQRRGRTWTGGLCEGPSSFCRFHVDVVSIDTPHGSSLFDGGGRGFCCANGRGHWGPPPVKRLLTSQPRPSPPRRRHCAQVRFRSIRVATTCEFPHPFFRARVDHHPTHHPPPPQIGPVGPTNQQGPRARVDARLARAPLGRLDSCNPRARRTRRFEVGRRRSAHVRVERRVSRRSSYHFTHPPNHHEHDSPAPDSRR